MIYEPVVPPIFEGLHVKGFFTDRHFDLSLSNVYLPVQKHTDKVIVLDHDLEPRVGDAVVTDRRDVLIGIQVADCVPVLLFDTVRKVVGAVHAGWRGTAEGILKKTVTIMMDRFCSSPSDLRIAIGPSIKKCCYCVGHEVIEAVNRTTGADYAAENGGKYYLDLPAANKYQAESMGIPSGNIWISGDCTFCLPEKYYSYRYAKGTAGRQYGFIGM